MGRCMAGFSNEYRPEDANPVDTSYRAMMWGPANFAGFPPRGLVIEGLLIGLLATGAVVGANVAGSFSDHVATGRISAAVVLAIVAIYLLRTNAGRVLVVLVLALGAALTWSTPRDTANAVLAERGQMRTVVVTDVIVQDYEGRDYTKNSCRVRRENGKPVTELAWSSCTLSTEPGDRLTMVFDPDGTFAPTDRFLPGSGFEAVRGLLIISLLSVATIFTAIVRSLP